MPASHEQRSEEVHIPPGTFWEYWRRVWDRARRETGKYAIAILTGLTGTSGSLLLVIAGLYWLVTGWPGARAQLVTLIYIFGGVFLCSFAFLSVSLARLPPLLEREAASAHESERVFLKARIDELESPSVLLVTYRAMRPWLTSTDSNAGYSLTIENKSGRSTDHVRVMVQIVRTEIDLRADGVTPQDNLHQFPKKWEIGKLSSGEPHFFPLIAHDYRLNHLALGPDSIIVPCWFYRLRVMVFCDASGPVVQHFTYTPEANPDARLVKV